MNKSLVAVTLVVILLVSVSQHVRGNDDKTPSWKAGASAVVITPKESMWMAGYAARRKPSEGKIHDLYAKALAVEDAEGSRVVIVTTDLISVPRPIRDWLEKATQEEFGLTPDRLLINCSHTHCGPELRTTESSLVGLEPRRVEQAKQYVADLKTKLLDVVGRAIDDMGPARVSYCRARSGFAMNRRTPGGPVDHDVPVLRVDRPDRKLYAVLFGYACHNTTLDFYQFCGDYAGFAQYYLEEAHPETTALFMLGCGGDQNPYPRRTLDLAQQHGRTLANAVETALQTQSHPLTGQLRSAYGMATLEYATPPTRAQVLQLAQSQNQYDRAWGERLLNQLERDGKLIDSYECPIQVVKFGDGLTVVALPGETVVDYSLRLKRELAQGSNTVPAIWVAGYSNDVFAYIPSRRVLEEGGYEAGGAMRYMTTTVQPGPFATSVEERILEKTLELNKQLSK